MGTCKALVKQMLRMFNILYSVPSDGNNSVLRTSEEFSSLTYSYLGVRKGLNFSQCFATTAKYCTYAVVRNTCLNDNLLL